MLRAETSARAASRAGVPCIRITRRLAVMLVTALLLAAACGTVYLLSLRAESADYAVVFAPALASFGIFAVTWNFLWLRTGEMPLFDIGIFAALSTAVYTCAPLVSYVLTGFTFESSDARLATYHISPAELGKFHWQHVLYLGMLCSAYCAIRTNKKASSQLRLKQANSLFLWAFLLVILGSILYYYYAYNAKLLWYSYGSKEYSDDITALASMPLLAKQIAGKLGYLYILAKIGAMLTLFVSQRRPLCGRLLAAWLAAEVFLVVWIRGMRTDFIFVCIAATLMWHRFVKPIRLPTLALGGGGLVFDLHVSGRVSKS